MERDIFCFQFELAEARVDTLKRHFESKFKEWDIHAIYVSCLQARVYKFKTCWNLKQSSEISTVLMWVGCS